jgi:hypothetical protein
VKIGAIIDDDILIMVFGMLLEDLFPSSERNNWRTCDIQTHIQVLDYNKVCK